jgi:hypothetical protein
VIALHGFAEALLNEITEPAMKRIAQRPCIGSIDQFSDNTDMLGDVERRTLLKQIFRE